MPRKNLYKFDKVKNVILFIWDYRCYICKLQKPDNHVHHINSQHWDNGSQNLIPLCKQCHKVVHKTLQLDNIVYPENVAHQLWVLDEIWQKFE